MIRCLRQDLERWKDEVSKGIVRGTTLHGIAKKAVDTFEVILRETVGVYRVLAGIESSTGKPFERLTFGELVQFLKKNNRRLTASVRRAPDGGQLFKNRTVVGPIRSLLDTISESRNDLHHRPLKFAPDTETLDRNTKKLLNNLSKALADQLFDYAAVQKR